MEFLALLFEWFTAAERWAGPESIPVRLWQHVWYTFVAVAVGAAIALPLGVGLGHLGRGGLLAINASNVGRAVPDFGLLVLVFILTGYGFLPVFVALTALAIPPMVTNSYTAMREVGAGIREAGTGMGMTRWQRLWQAEVPNAWPLILAGIRTSTLQVIATATLAAFVGLGGFGRYIIDGLATRDTIQVVGGAILVALLALLVESLLARVQTLALPGKRAVRAPSGAEPREAASA